MKGRRRSDFAFIIQLGMILKCLQFGKSLALNLFTFRWLNYFGSFRVVDPIFAVYAPLSNIVTILFTIVNLWSKCKLKNGFKYWNYFKFVCCFCFKSKNRIQQTLSTLTLHKNHSNDTLSSFCTRLHMKSSRFVDQRINDIISWLTLQVALIRWVEQLRVKLL